MPITRLNAVDPEQDFPNPATALHEPNGLLAYGGCLSTTRLLKAYQLGIFPWYNPDEPILWWSPNPRLVIFPDKLYVSKSLAKSLRKSQLSIRYNQAFAEVMHGCAAPRAASSGTWIDNAMLTAYLALHQQGYAHSFEAWHEQELVAGLYGVAIGRVFFGESMFHKQTDASKIVFVHFVNQLKIWGYQLIDCQVRSDHMLSLGAEQISRSQFQKLLLNLTKLAPVPEAWLT